MALSGVLGRLSDAWNPFDPTRLKPRPDGIEPIRIEESEVRRSTVRIVLVFFLAFCFWAVYAPLDSGVVMQGSVIVSGNRKAVQHPSGGVVQALMVREGSVVKEGDVVLKVNPLNTAANLTSAELQYINLLATESRLMAERLNARITWRAELRRFAADDPRVLEAKALQVQLYNSRREAQENELRILREQQASQEAQSTSLSKVITEKRAQLALSEREASNISQLAREGYVPESQANAALRARSALVSELANLQAEVSRNASEIASTRLKMSQARGLFLKEVDAELSEIQKNREAYATRMDSLDFDRRLAEVRAPASGSIVGLKVFTVGGVITAGQVLMEIVPEESTLIVEAKIQPNDIDKVNVGLPTDLRFSAFNQRTTPVIPGEVKLVGADKLTDPAGGEEYYLAQVETTAEGRKLLENYRIQPGMPVEVIVKTGERSFASYILKPLTDRMARSFKED